MKTRERITEYVCSRQILIPLHSTPHRLSMLCLLSMLLHLSMLRQGSVLRRCSLAIPLRSTPNPRRRVLPAMRTGTRDYIKLYQKRVVIKLLLLFLNLVISKLIMFLTSDIFSKSGDKRIKTEIAISYSHKHAQRVRQRGKGLFAINLYKCTDRKVEII